MNVIDILFIVLDNFLKISFGGRKKKEEKKEKEKKNVIKFDVHLTSLVKS